MDRCPNCNARHRGDTLCHRCGMELDTLLAIEQRAEAWEKLAVARLASGDPAGAQAAARQALRWQRRELAVEICGFVEWLVGAYLTRIDLGKGDDGALGND